MLSERHLVTKCQALHNEFEHLVSRGEHEKCRDKLSKLSLMKLPREFAQKFGQLAFRVHAPLLTLKFLHKYVHPENALVKAASDQERLIYSSALFGLGAVKESMEILAPISPEKEPEVYYYLAIANFFDWNYEASVPLLKNFINSSKITPYRRLVGKVNLAAAHICVCNWSAAEPLLKEIIAECVEGDHKLLLGNCYELAAQIELFQGRYDTAVANLKEACELLQNQGGLYSLFVDKWTAICACLTTGEPTDFEKLEAVRTKGLQERHWETVRECDLFKAVAGQDELLVRKVVMGSPSELYRQRVRRLFGTTIRSKGRFLLFLGNPDQKNSVIETFDPYKKTVMNEALTGKRYLLAVFEALTQDFYKPATIGVLFQRIYPSEKFNPFTSPARVLQLLKRLNRWFIHNQSSVRVQFRKSEFCLTSDGAVYVVVQRGKPLSAVESQILSLKEELGGRTFSAAKAALVLNCSKVSSQKLLKQGVKDGVLEIAGRGPSTIYYFANQRGKRRSA